MCVTSRAALLENTVVGGWDIQHPTYGYRHVLAYQNAPKSLAAGANCMLLHVPSAKDLIPSDLIDTASCPNLLYDLSYNLLEEQNKNSRGGFDPPRQNYVLEMGVYHVALLNNLNTAALTTVLSQIPEEKRPTIDPALLDFYANRFPKYRLILACFNNKDLKTASAIMVHYQPLFPNKVFFPLLEGHDGKVPRIGQNIRMHQQIIYGSVSKIQSTLIPLSMPNVPKALHPFLPKYAGYQSLDGEVLPNNDDWFEIDTKYI